MPVLETLFELAKGSLLLLGSFLVLVGAIGLFRLPDLFSRLHVGGITDILGVLLISIALYLEFPTMPKILLINVFIWLGNPMVTHMIAKRAYAKTERSSNKKTR